MILYITDVKSPVNNLDIERLVKELNINDLEAYKVLDREKLGDINSQGTVLEHKKTGARIVLVSNDDRNKTFLIGFRTPVDDSTGVPHIMEHSVLCGSRKFPVKDPFIELAKGSLNTFLNAMTFPDKTIFPIASENDKDFQNLMDVYLDAVFYPKIYEREEIFRQEGWTYALDNKDDDITYNGVVYNEMKGAFSAADEIIERNAMNALFPDNTYSNESGGDPDDIPNLTYEQFLSFHKRYYHPSNSYIYLYGDMDMAEKLDFIDKEYLSKFDKEQIDSVIKEQPAFDKIKEIEMEYPVAANENESENTYLSYNAVVGKITDKELYVAFQVLEYALVSMPGSPVKQALIDKGIGKDIDGKYNNWIYQPYFSITAKNAEPEQKDEFENVIIDTLKGLVESGIDKNSLLAALNYFEFQYREADFGSYPKGLMFSFQILDSWLYDDKHPFTHLHENEVFEKLRNKIDSGYFEELVQTYLIDNTHAVVLTATPKKGLTTKKDEELKAQLKKYKESLNEKSLNSLVEWTKHLEEYKSEPSSKDDLEKIPLLKISDISEDIKPFHNKEYDADGIKIVHHELFTNGIGYLAVMFDITDIPKKYYPYLGMLKAILGYMSTDKYDYSELTNVINMNTGGMYSDVSVYPDAKENGRFGIMASYSAKVFADKLDFALKMIGEIVNTSKLDDEKRLGEIISELKAKLQMSLSHSGDSAALLRDMSYYSESGCVSEQLKGISFYKFIEDCEKNYADKKNGIIDNLKKVIKYVFRKDNMIISYTSDKDGLEILKNSLKEFSLVMNGEKTEDASDHSIPCQKNEAFKSSAQIQYVTRAGNFIKDGYQYDGSLKVLRSIMNFEYLWNNVRVKGGAYGCSAGFNRTGDCYFTSYRDPNLSATNKVFESVPEYVKNFNVSDRDMTKFIIGTISSMDTPLTPNIDGLRSMSAYISNLTEDELIEERKQVLTTDCTKIRTHAELIEAVLEQGNICVLGNEDKIEEDKELFKEVINLFE